MDDTGCTNVSLAGCPSQFEGASLVAGTFPSHVEAEAVNQLTNTIHSCQPSGEIEDSSSLNMYLEGSHSPLNETAQPHYEAGKTAGCEDNSRAQVIATEATVSSLSCNEHASPLLDYASPSFIISECVSL